MSFLDELIVDGHDYILSRLTRGLKAKPLFYGTTPCMLAEDAARIEQAIHKEPWTVGRRVIINRESSTISLFDEGDRHTSFSCKTAIPLYYQGIPIIPHHFYSDATPLLTPTELSTSSTETTLDGLADAQIRQLMAYIGPHLKTIDFFLDRRVVVTVPLASYPKVMCQIGSPFFKAWDCIFRLVPSPEDDPRLWIHRTNLNPLNLTAPEFDIQGASGVRSTMGALLCSRTEKQFASNPAIRFFTVSRQSFRFKRDIGIHLDFLSMIVLGVVSYLAYTGAEQAVLPLHLHQQLILTRCGIILQDSLWMYAGRRLGCHFLVYLDVLKLIRRLAGFALKSAAQC